MCGFVASSLIYVCFQLCGSTLDETEFRSSVDVIIEGLRQAVVDDGSGRLALCEQFYYLLVIPPYGSMGRYLVYCV